jgi:hypothetical protein
VNYATPLFAHAPSVIGMDLSIIWLYGSSSLFEFSGHPIRHRDDQIQFHHSRPNPDLNQFCYLAQAQKIGFFVF